MTGDVERAVEELRGAPLDQVPASIQSAVSRLLVHCLLLSGHADEAAAVTERLLATTRDRTIRYLWAISRWMLGEPGELLALGRASVDIPAVTSRDEFVRRTLVATMLASTGRYGEVHRLVDGAGFSPRPFDARDAVLEAVAHALCAIVDHDEAPAAQLIADVASAHAASPILDQHLRRFLSLAYVLDASIRSRWDVATHGSDA